jgi:hypothetical protein
MAMSMMSQWFGLSAPAASAASSPSTPQQRSAPDAAGRPRPLAIHTPGQAPQQQSQLPSRPLQKTKSDELLRDFDAMRFLADVDDRLKVHRTPLPEEHAGRLEALYAQALADGCQPLMDIVEHFETLAVALRGCAGSSNLPPPKVVESRVVQ